MPQSSSETNWYKIQLNHRCNMRYKNGDNWCSGQRRCSTLRGGKPFWQWMKFTCLPPQYILKGKILCIYRHINKSFVRSDNNFYILPLSWYCCLLKMHESSFDWPKHNLLSCVHFYFSTTPLIFVFFLFIWVSEQDFYFAKYFIELLIVRVCGRERERERKHGNNNK